jgi:hypothetical protein
MIFDSKLNEIRHARTDSSRRDRPRIKVSPQATLSNSEKLAIFRQYLEVIRFNARTTLDAIDTQPDPQTPETEEAVLLSESGSSGEQLPPTGLFGERSERAEPSSRRT